MTQSKCNAVGAATESKDELRLINILAELCQCDPAKIEWDGDGSIDTVAFKTESCRYLLKLARESVQGQSGSIMDFRVRVLIR